MIIDGITDINIATPMLCRMLNTMSIQYSVHMPHIKDVTATMIEPIMVNLFKRPFLDILPKGRTNADSPAEQTIKIRELSITEISKNVLIVGRETLNKE